MKFLNLFFLSVFIVQLSAAPKNIYQKCQVHDDGCILKTSNYILKHFKEGVKSLNLGSIDPLQFRDLRFIQDTGAVAVDTASPNFIVKGLSTARFIKFKGFDKNLLELNLFAPSLTFSGPYRTKARVLYLPLDFSGHFIVTIINMKIDVKFNLQRFKKDNKEFFKITNSTVDFDLDDFEIIEPDIGYVLNAFLKSTYVLIKNSLGSAASELGGDIIGKKLEDEIFSKNSIDHLFLSY